jgi:glycosyltransferase involved in cell wall biosynthesis
MRIGFYAPLKSPNSPVPSGDRKMARLLMKALQNLGHDVELVSEFRSWEGRGDSGQQSYIQAQADKEFMSVCAKYKAGRKLDCIFTYHLYHKAPDWIGGRLADYLDVPYLIAEASYAPKQSQGYWNVGHQQAEKCIRQARGVLSLNKDDMDCVNSILVEGQVHMFVHPFSDEVAVKISDLDADRQLFSQKFGIASSSVWLVCTAMMRQGDKFKSFQLLSNTLGNIALADWKLIVIGDGEQRLEVEALFKFYRDRVIFTGQLGYPELKKWLGCCDLYVWPGYREAFGLALLEAVSAGLPTVSYDYGGISSIIRNQFNGIVVEPGNSEKFAKSVFDLIADSSLRQTMSENAIEKYRQDHTLDAAKIKLAKFLKEVI